MEIHPYLPFYERAVATEINFKRRRISCFISVHGYRMVDEKEHQCRIKIVPILTQPRDTKLVPSLYKIRLCEFTSLTKGKTLNIYVENVQ